VNVAYSAAKQLEAPMVAKAVKKKLLLNNISLPSNAVCGFVGQGAIGRAVSDFFLSLGHKVIVFDKLGKIYETAPDVVFAENLQSLVEESDFIFGCTGTDVTTDLDLSKLRGIKNFISCSSQDTEFLTLLKHVQSKMGPTKIWNVLSDVEFPLYPPNHGLIRIIKGGHPVNFDNTPLSGPAEEFQLPRGLLLAGIVQAFLQLSDVDVPEAKQYMLHPSLQKFIAKSFFSEHLDSVNEIWNKPEVIKNFLNAEWIRKNSSGDFIELAVFGE